MKARLLGLVLLAGAASCAGAADDGNVAGREAQLAAAALVKQNEALRAEVNRLREEVAKLTMTLMTMLSVQLGLCPMAAFGTNWAAVS